jgi:hypothetical protein
LLKGLFIEVEVDGRDRVVFRIDRGKEKMFT